MKCGIYRNCELLLDWRKMKHCKAEKVEEKAEKRKKYRFVYFILWLFIYSLIEHWLTLAGKRNKKSFISYVSLVKMTFKYVSMCVCVCVYELCVSVCYLSDLTVKVCSKKKDFNCDCFYISSYVLVEVFMCIRV